MLIGLVLWVVADGQCDAVWFAAKEQEQQRTQQAVDTPRTKPNDEARIQREEMRKELLGEK